MPEVNLSLVKWHSIQDLKGYGYTSEIAQVPFSYVKDNNIYTYVAGRSSSNQSYVNLIILDSDFNVLTVKEQVFQKSNAQGTFDDEGVMPASVVQYSSIS